MRVTMRSTGRRLIGYDKYSGEVIRRNIYADRDGNEYVRLGKYCLYDRDACVRKEWFCEHVIEDGAIVRRA